jgi:hypothetical protein
MSNTAPVAYEAEHALVPTALLERREARVANNFFGYHGSASAHLFHRSRPHGLEPVEEHPLNPTPTRGLVLSTSLYRKKPFEECALVGVVHPKQAVARVLVVFELVHVTSRVVSRGVIVPVGEIYYDQAYSSGE